MQEWYSFRPGPALAPYFDGVCGYRLDGFRPGEHVGMPAPRLTLIVTLGEPIHVSLQGGAPQRYEALASGLTPFPVGIHHDGSQHGLQLDLTVAGARALLGVPAGELTGQVVDLSDVLLPADRYVAEEATEREDWAGRIAVVVRALTRRLSDVRPARAEVTHAWDKIRRTHGTVPVWAVASEVGWSTRHLGEKFRAEYGVTPKTAARLSRFDRSRRLLRSRTSGIADIAAACGYADQAHLTREWQAFAGNTPRQWAAADELAFLQEDDLGTEAGSHHD